MTVKEMKQLVQLARSYDRAEQWMEKIWRAEVRLREMRVLGAPEGWLEQQRKELLLQRRQARRLSSRSKIAHLQLRRLFESMDDEYMYNILSRHYLSGHTWRYIAMTVGGGNTADGIRKAASRYLKRLSIVDIAQKP